MSEYYAQEGQYSGEPAILLRYGPYSAIMLPRIGGNLISFRDETNGYRFLNEPSEDEWQEFVGYPIKHGIPVLFPPNRFDSGTFEFGGRQYQFPINEPSTGNHLHGFVYDSPWTVDSFGSDSTRSYVTVKLRFDERHPSYEHFPHTFTLSNTYELSDSGLAQTFSAVNEGDTEMPFMLGYHTAVSAPFAPGSSADDLECLITIGERLELNSRMLPTGQTFPLSDGEQKLKQGNGDPYFEALDNHYTSAPQNGRNVMTLTDRKVNVRLTYEIGEQYKLWMVWNNGACRQFFCPEPQTNMVNAPNLALPAEQTGLLSLKPGESWSETCKLYAESI